METKGRRASERMELEIPIEVAGTDCLGSQFFDRTHTLVVGHHGGKIALEHKLVSQQEVTIRCLATGREAEALILGLLGESRGTYYYGIKFLGGKSNIWGIEFAPLTESERVIGRVLLECIGCKNREVICLDDFELEVLKVNGHISRSCKHCRDVSLWRKSLEDMPESETATPASSPPSLPSSKTGGVSLAAKCGSRRVCAQLASARIWSKFEMYRAVGLCFTSPWEYVLGEVVEVAVPYSPGGGNIFMAAKIVRLQLLASEGKRIYGVAFQSPKR